MTYIYTGLKILGKEQIAKDLEQYVSALKKHPGLMRVFDLVHYEDSIYLGEILNMLIETKQKHPEVIYGLHAGETRKSSNQNVIDSVLLGTKRIGHGLTVARNKLTMDLVKEREICVEVNPLSNLLLGYCRDLVHHPAKQLIANGNPITLNPDDYFCFGEHGATPDFFLAVLYFDFDLRDLKWCCHNSFKYSYFSEEVQKTLRVKFDK